MKAYAYRYESCEVLKVLGGLDLRLPSLFVVTVPELHGFGIILDFAVRRIEVKFAVDEPGDVGELKHGDGNVANGNWGVELLAFADAGDEVGEVEVGHRVRADGVGALG